MAGGAGTRLWPLSRQDRPKQLLRLFGGRSLLSLSRDRLRNLFPPERIWIICSAAHLELVAAELPDVPRENLIGEPVGRDTAGAIGLGTAIIARHDADATVAVFTADHVIEPQTEFEAAIEAGLAVAEQHPDTLATFGIRPRQPHTGYGYIRRGASAGAGIYTVESFHEKPDEATARTYVESGAYYWNSGMFAWRAATILGEMRRCLPDHARLIAEIAADWPACAEAREFAEKFAGLKPISIDYGVMEKARLVQAVEMNCRWLDLGSWVSVAEHHEADSANNVHLAPNALVMDGANNILASEGDHLLVVLGADDLIVVHSPDATLICRKGQEGKMKQLGERRRQRFGARYE